VEHRLQDAQQRREQLVDVFVYRRAIDQQTEPEQIDKLNEEIVLAELDEREARIEELDVQAAVSFGEFIRLNARRLWAELSLHQKQTLQQVISPLGMQFEDRVCRTAETSMVFFNLEAHQPEKQSLVDVLYSKSEENAISNSSRMLLRRAASRGFA
jgi:hypothetical protein